MGSRIPIILDAKRGDIASTAEAYARSAFENLGVDCITLNPYLGKDSIEPFLKNQEKGVFILCKTSNMGANDLQDLMVSLDDRPQTMELEPLSMVNRPSSIPLYEYVASLAQSWNSHNNIGLVVGATYPETLTRVREIASEMWFLAPGVGAQGGELESALKAGLRKDRKGMLINVSRSIARAEKPGLAAAELRDSILEIRESMLANR
jgi:orotidine 5'-phosphate decarboxylase subfamily 2